MKRIITSLILICITGLLHAQCPLFQMKPMLEERCPQFTTDTTSLHSTLKAENGYEYSMNYRALRLNAPRKEIPVEVVHELKEKFLQNMAVAQRANHYESHQDGRDTISFTLTHGDLKGLIRSIDKQVYSRDTMWSASLLITADSIRFLTLSTWNARVKSIPLSEEQIRQLRNSQ
jgi:hypothetical protein